MLAGRIDRQLVLVSWPAATDPRNTAIVERQGVTLLVDPLSYQYLLGSEIDYIENLQGAQFVVNNPNASATCGCGNSFAV